jgi:hypothetical protein
MEMRDLIGSKYFITMAAYGLSGKYREDTRKNFS